MGESLYDGFFGAPNYVTWSLVRWIGEIEAWRNESWSLCDPSFSLSKAKRHMKTMWNGRLQEWLGERLPSPFADMTLASFDEVDWVFVAKCFRKRGWWPKSREDMLMASERT